mgnify:FL=1
MCYNTEYVGYEQKRIKQEHILFMGGGVTLPASCGLAVCPGCEETKKDMPEGEKHTWRKH